MHSTRIDRFRSSPAADSGAGRALDVAPAAFGVIPVARARVSQVPSDLHPVPPVAKRVPHAFRFGDVSHADAYAWLENPEDPEVIAYLRAENAYTEAVMAPYAALRETLYQEMVGRIQRTDTKIPFRMGENVYYTRTETGRDYDILCRRRDALDAPEEVLLDLNEMARGYLVLGYYAPSYDGRYLAYALNETGGLQHTLYVKDLVTGEILPERLPSDGYGFEWAADNRTLFYTRQDETLRPCELYRHALGTDVATDLRLYHEHDPVFDLSLSISDSKAYLFLLSTSFESSEVHYLRADQPAGAFTCFAPRRPGILYSLEHHGDEFLVLTNDDAVNFKLEAVPVASPDGRRRELIPHRDGALLQCVDVFAGHLLVSGREDGLSRLWIHDIARDQTRPLAFAEPVHTVRVGDNREFHTERAVISYTSPVTPLSFFELDLGSGERELIKQEEVVGGHDPGRYLTARVFATAPDGARVPISLVRRGDTPPGPRPLLLRAYGAYGHCLDPVFASNELSLVDRGVSFAIAHVRGGQEMGRPWYEDGKLLHKKHTFSDVVACAEHLIAIGETAPDRLVAQGGSAGGLVMGVLANERPELFRAIVAQVPFVDALRVMLDPSLPLTTAEYAEWGNPRDPVFYDYIRAYSPCDNVAPRAYPRLFVTAGLSDDQVPFWQPAKWTARLRAAKPDDTPLLLRTNLGAGHRGYSGFSDAQHEIAFMYAFVLAALGLDDAAVDDRARASWSLRENGPPL
jgi:oligopeptidase B